MSIGKPEQKAIASHDNFFILVLFCIWFSNLDICYFYFYKYLSATLECRKMISPVQPVVPVIPTNNKQPPKDRK